MKNLVLTTATIVLIITVSALFINAHYMELPTIELEHMPVEVSQTVGKPGKTLKAFRSKAELEKFLREFSKKAERRKAENKMVAKSPSPTADASAASEGESITNNQHAGVDEGGIVKLHGDHLVILRRGRLFTVRIGDRALRPVSAIDAYPPDANPGGTWYDEMLISGNTIAVIGYSYARGGTEVGLFDINRSGGLSYRSTYHLKSNDYYSSRNYASRLIKGKLIFYTPQYLWINPNDPTERFPAIRKWRKGATKNEFRKIVAATRVYRPAQKIESPYGLALHTVTVCDLNTREFDCEATGVIGPAGRVFYVSPKSVYVWTTDWVRRNNRSQTRSVLYKMPLTGGAPQALRVSGSPVDQFSFLESNDHHLNVLVRNDGGGEAMWGSEVSNGDIALLRVPTWSFSDGTRNASHWNYKPLPRVEGYTLQNRFVGDHLLYGTGNGWGRQNKKASTLYAVNWRSGATDELPLEHTVDRIEGLGKDALVVGTRGKDLYFSPVKLSGEPKVKAGYVRRNASQGELRSHGFFYRPNGRNSGTLGLPIAEAGRPGYKHLVQGSASILFLKNDSLKLKEIGTLASGNTRQPNDNCKASCVDWYGNARPIFLRGRIFALLGYELVEGTSNRSGIRELRRTNFSPVKGKYARLID
ncbi:MAG: hypothetical protein HKN33_13700 [Pyrinomonadaceae bacterium]|nr:hypothetical protein [Pyrinomonadaceae bacterium]